MKTPWQLIKAVYNRLDYYLCPDKVYLNRKFKSVFGRNVNWKNPVTFNEKLQWLKVYDRNPLYTKLVDKYEVRKYIADKLGEQHLIPALGVWERFEDIDFNALPDQFVLKCTHDSASVIVCKDKATFDIEAARKKLSACLKRNFYYSHREWPYKNVKPRIMAEQYMEDDVSKELRDYKFFAFDGTVRALFIASDRQAENTEVKFDFFDADFNHLDVRQGHPNSITLPQKPMHFDIMKELVARLSVGFPHVRVDFYECNGRVYFGEITFFHHSGFVPFDPPKWDEIFGSWLELPHERRRAE